jgi:hypothetical protein
MSTFCKYYQAHVVKADCIFFVAILRSFDHLAFDRTLDQPNQIFEFFVPVLMEQQFLTLMAFFEKKEIIKNLQQLPNRLLDDTEKV